MVAMMADLKAGLTVGHLAVLLAERLAENWVARSVDWLVGSKVE